MIQILQYLGKGETILAKVPCPRRGARHLLVESAASLVSLGTEKMLLDFGKGSLIAKARQQPDKVVEVLRKVKTDGLLTTVDAVRSKLDQPLALGYSSVGRVVECDDNSPFVVGDRVVSNGPHAEMVCVPETLAAKVPEGVSNESAAFTVVGSIGLQGIRLIKPTLGERIVVMGLGLIGLLTVQMLRAHGCRVLGVDFDEDKLKLAASYGAKTVSLKTGEDPVAAADTWTAGVGVDGVIITAATKSDEVVSQAAAMCRKRGRIVLVGVVGLNLKRADFYEKELSFQVSCSYGPGRYDPNYEAKGLDYPIGFVRWTEARNFEAVLQLLAEGKLDVSSLVSHRFTIGSALEAYDVVSSGRALGIVLSYSVEEKLEEVPNGKLARTVSIGAIRGKGSGVPRSGVPTIAVIGAGNFTTRTLLPALEGVDIHKKVVVSSGGVTGSYAATKFGFESSSTDVDTVLGDGGIDAVMITTPHHTHARLVCQALRAGKHVFVEKPLGLTLDEIDKIEEAATTARDRCLMLGFNRRFSPHMVALKGGLKGTREARAMILTMNAGAIPATHWTQDPEVGGGRIVGEACHFVDLARFLAESPIVDASGHFLGGHDGRLGDCASLQLGFENGSAASVHYFSNGHKGYPKERVEVFCEGKIVSCDNFRKTVGFGANAKCKTRSLDKGHAAGVRAFCQAVREGGEWPIPLDEILEVSRVSIRLAAQFQR